MQQNIKRKLPRHPGTKPQQARISGSLRHVRAAAHPFFRKSRQHRFSSCWIGEVKSTCLSRFVTSVPSIAKEKEFKHSVEKKQKK